MILSWTWQDEDAWDLVSFTLKKDGVEITSAIPNAKPYAANALLSRSATVVDAEAGEYCVEVMAKYQTAPALTHHSSSCVDVVLEEPIRFQVLLRRTTALHSSQAFNRNAGSWNYEFVVKIFDGTNATAASRSARQGLPSTRPAREPGACLSS